MKKLNPLILLVLLAFVSISCNKNIDNTGTGEFAPIAADILIATNDITSITSYSAMTGGYIINAGGTPITGQGICYGTHSQPTINDVSVPASTTADTFSITLTGLTIHTVYYVRAYTISSAGASYGNERVFTTTLAIGQDYLDGILFYLSSTGDSGLVAFPSDQSAAAAWGCPGTTVVTSYSTYTGKQNTASIINHCGDTGIAARLCNALNTTGDWYLPSLDELELLYNNRRAVGNLSNSQYWTSSQYNSDFSGTKAYFLDFSNNNPTFSDKGSTLHVRAIRAFFSN